MANFKLNISDTKGLTITKETKENISSRFLGLKIGNDLDASIFDLQGKLKITGGSDISGVPMRSDISGTIRKYVLLSNGVGIKHTTHGQRIRKLVHGDTVSDDIHQINCKFDGILKINDKQNQ